MIGCLLGARNFAPCFLIVIFVLCGCTDGTTSSYPEEAPGLWQRVDFVPNPDETGKVGSGFQKVTHVGRHLFVMDAYTLSGGDTRYRMFTSEIGSGIWDTLSLPEGRYAESWVSDGEYLYIGADTLSEVYKYSPDSKELFRLPVAHEDHRFRVSGVAVFKGSIVAGLSSNQTYNRPIMWLQNDTDWVNINADSSFLNTASWHTGLEFKGDLYVATYAEGIYQYFTDQQTWQEVTPPPPSATRVSRGLDWSFHGSRGILIFEDHLVVSYRGGGGVQKYLGDGVWERLDSVIYIPEGKYFQGNIGLHNYALATWNGRLITAGYYPSVPFLYVGDEHPKGWQRIDQESWYDWYISNVYDMDVVGDSLYVAGYEGLIVFPLEKLDEATEGAAIYPAFPE